MRLAGQENVPLGEVQKVLRTDVAFSAEVLRLANSALIGLGAVAEPGSVAELIRTAQGR